MLGISNYYTDIEVEYSKLNILLLQEENYRVLLYILQCND